MTMTTITIAVPCPLSPVPSYPVFVGRDLIDKVGSLPSNFTHIRPLAPSFFAYSVSSSIRLREYDDARGMTIARTEPPASIASFIGANSTSRAQFVRSTSSMPKRVSGRSMP